jgi:hypothetical protein
MGMEQLEVGLSFLYVSISAWKSGWGW